MKIDLRGIWKIGSREWWTIGRHTLCVSFPEWLVFRACWLGQDILKAFGFYATKCSCKKTSGGKVVYEKPMKFRLFMCRDCIKNKGAKK